MTRSHNLNRVVTHWPEPAEINWDAIYAEQLPQVFNFFRYHTGDNALAEDLTATTFEKAWRYRERYKHDVAEFSTWVFSIARNVALDHFRSHRRPRNAAISLEQAGDPAGEGSVEDAVQRRQDFARLHRLLATLPARERELIALKFGAGLTNRAIARLLKLSESNVGTILNRITTRLGESWEEAQGAE